MVISCFYAEIWILTIFFFIIKFKEKKYEIVIDFLALVFSCFHVNSKINSTVNWKLIYLYIILSHASYIKRRIILRLFLFVINLLIKTRFKLKLCYVNGEHCQSKVRRHYVINLKFLVEEIKEVLRSANAMLIYTYGWIASISTISQLLKYIKN